MKLENLTRCISYTGRSLYTPRFIICLYSLFILAAIGFIYWLYDNIDQLEKDDIEAEDIFDVNYKA